MKYFPPCDHCKKQDDCTRKEREANCGCEEIEIYEEIRAEEEATTNGTNAEPVAVVPAVEVTPVQPVQPAQPAQPVQKTVVEPMQPQKQPQNQGQKQGKNEDPKKFIEITPAADTINITGDDEFTNMTDGEALSVIAQIPARCWRAFENDERNAIQKAIQALEQKKVVAKSTAAIGKALSNLYNICELELAGK